MKHTTILMQNIDKKIIYKTRNQSKWVSSILWLLWWQLIFNENYILILDYKSSKLQIYNVNTRTIFLIKVEKHIWNVRRNKMLQLIMKLSCLSKPLCFHVYFTKSRLPIRELSVSHCTLGVIGKILIDFCLRAVNFWITVTVEEDRTICAFWTKLKFSTQMFKRFHLKCLKFSPQMFKSFYLKCLKVFTLNV